MASYSYVKFQRGTLTAFNNLRAKDPDTLYFIYADANNQYGSLYLGDKLISGGEVTVVSSSLADLTDTSLSSVQDGQILVYDSSTSKWKNFDLATAIQNAGIETGNKVNNIIPEDGQSDGEALAGITEPSIGDIAFIGDNIYIYNGEEWKQISGVSQESSGLRYWTAENIYPSMLPGTGLTTAAQNKYDQYRAEAITRAEFYAWFGVHLNEFDYQINITTRKEDLRSDSLTEPAVDDLVFGPGIVVRPSDYLLAQDYNLKDIYQIVEIRNENSIYLKSLTSYDPYLKQRLINVENLLGVPANDILGDSATGLHAVVAEKVGSDEVAQMIADAVGNLNQLSYQKVNSLNDIILDAEDAEKHIYLVPQDPGSENDGYDEYLVIDGALEKMGQWGVGDLSTLQDEVNNLNQIINGAPASQDQPAVPGLVDQIANLQDIVGDITQLFNYDSENPTTIVNTINEINERLIWEEMEDPNDGN